MARRALQRVCRARSHETRGVTTRALSDVRDPRPSYRHPDESAARWLSNDVDDRDKVTRPYPNHASSGTFPRMSSDQHRDSEVATKAGPITFVAIAIIALLEAFLLIAGQTAA
ncbi:MAG: hypothetical protein HOV81_01930 [Kofleriaceae bacterium]|nr:hypothetical protein [Kofleriaceae bacterium]